MPDLSEWLSDKFFSRIIILTDDNTAEFCLPQIAGMIRIPFNHISIPAGEQSKSLDSAALIWNKLLEFGSDRNALLINLGGGMITDLGGFCAATYKRGISFINIPTTLLGMVDASIGGKTGIDIGPNKNQVGLFAPAAATFSYPYFLKTLPERELISGFAEILKYGLISDPTLWGSIHTTQPKDINNWDSIIDACVKIKQSVVNQDPYDQGIRKILNFGHTIGHAIESFSLQNSENPLLHGEAVAIGIIAEAWLSNKKSGLTVSQLEEITKALIRFCRSFAFEKSDFDELYNYMLNDKKISYNSIRFALLEEIGKPVYDISCTYTEIKAAMDYYISVLSK